jgi:acyl-CoA thioester hydrolase
MQIHTTKIQVRYFETDAMGVVHHANYAVWLEQARTEYMAAAGLPYRAVEARGLYIMLSKLEVNYRRAARYDDTVLVETRAAELKSRRARFEYRLTLEDDTLVALCATEHFCTDHTLKIVSFPPDVLEIFR